MGMATLPTRWSLVTLEQLEDMCLFVPEWYLNSKAALIVSGKRDHLSKASIQDTVLVGFCKLRSRWDGGVVRRSALSFVSSGNNVGVVANIVHIVFTPFLPSSSPPISDSSA